MIELHVVRGTRHSMLYVSIQDIRSTCQRLRAEGAIVLHSMTV